MEEDKWKDGEIRKGGRDGGEGSILELGSASGPLVSSETTNWMNREEKKIESQSVSDRYDSTSDIIELNPQKTDLRNHSCPDVRFHTLNKKSPCS